MIDHTKEPWGAQESRLYANEWFITAGENKNWLMSIRHNGEAMPEKQRENVLRIVACVNACGGFSTEALEAQVLAGRGIIRAFQDQRDDLIATLKEIQAAGGYPERVYELTKAAIAKAQGGE